MCACCGRLQQAAVLSTQLTSALHSQAAKTKTKCLVKLTDNTGSPLPQNAAPGRRRRRKGNRTARGPASSDKNLLAGAELTPRRPKQLQVCQLPPPPPFPTSSNSHDTQSPPPSPAPGLTRRRRVFRHGRLWRCPCWHPALGWPRAVCWRQLLLRAHPAYHWRPTAHGAQPCKWHWRRWCRRRCRHVRAAS